jgi:hypothetical protein
MHLHPQNGPSHTKAPIHAERALSQLSDEPLKKLSVRPGKNVLLNACEGSVKIGGGKCRGRWNV